MSPACSIGVPVYNGEQFLERCLDSLLAQTLTDIEIVVADNKSTDASLEIARSFAARDDRVRVLPAQENLGAAWNFNRLVEATSAPYFCWSPHDDEREPDALRQCVAALNAAGPKTVLAYNRAVFIDSESKLVGPDTDEFVLTSRRPAFRLARALHELNLASPVLGVMRRSALDQTRLIDSFAGSDYVLLSEMAMLGRTVEVPEVGFRRRMHEQSSREAAKSREEVQAWFDPRGRVSKLSDRSRLLLEYHRSATRLPIPLLDRLLCLGIIAPARTMKRARVVGGALKDRLRGTTSGETADEE
ncbi:MAG: glycosyltransferase involved in cell wall biosynthesis [Candidatus Aldehydirespiratoraceae bacterium]|jgi:glycosyltransferase involved in cell wall biosynthesis